MAYLPYLKDEIIQGLVKDVLMIGRKKKQAVIRDFEKNVIDPFSSLFDSAVSGVNHETWKNSEMVRQCQKTLTNHIGNLHQKILGSVVGWQDLGTGGVVDLVCHEKKIIAEVKNKYNTVTGGKLADQYNSLERLVTPKASQYKGYTSYFVNIIPKKPERFDTTFEPSDKDKGIKCPPNELIRITDGASFYQLVTGRKNALSELYEALPDIIEDIYRNDFNEPNFEIQDKSLFKQYFVNAYIEK
ncbi:Eco47II family restriction endonuclease [Agaribacter flavus]|uniref:Eco47II family restriction endonuclease n=1 Tax=Agaribacter flavus TaxID=1902781 RepID=A0ABV7FPB1_9ALTE